MRQILFACAIVVIGIVGLGFYLNWFHVGSEKAEGKSSFTMSMDTDKFHADEKKAVTKVKTFEQQIQTKVTGPAEKSMDGTVVSVSADKLSMTNERGTEHSHALAEKVKVTCDGKAGTTADLKPGMKVHVTMDPANPQTVIRIDTIAKDSAQASTSHDDGDVVSINNDELVMTSWDGKGNHTHALAPGVKVTCDGKECKSADLKPGMKVRVTTENTEPHAALRIEAIDNNRVFEKGV
jgi:hypothetical protein